MYLRFKPGLQGSRLESFSFSMRYAILNTEAEICAFGELEKKIHHFNSPGRKPNVHVPSRLSYNIC